MLPGQEYNLAQTSTLLFTLEPLRPLLWIDSLKLCKCVYCSSHSTVSYLDGTDFVLLIRLCMAQSAWYNIAHVICYVI